MFYSTAILNYSGKYLSFSLPNNIFLLHRNYEYFPASTFRDYSLPTHLIDFIVCEQNNQCSKVGSFILTDISMMKQMELS